jgi:phosphatidylserine/phosphatidylglycerophosphate/cardiolipin synthase-like enzyme
MDSLLSLGKYVGAGYNRNKIVQAAVGEFPTNTPANVVTLFAPDDDVHGALMTLISSARQSLVVAMYGFDDEPVARVIGGKMQDPHMFVQLSFDSSQAGGVHERVLLEKMKFPGNMVAYGRSERGAIMHMKMFIIDGRFVGGGSTNWSDGGEDKQDNHLTIIDDATHAARARAKIDLIHATMQAQMAAKSA